MTKTLCNSLFIVLLSLSGRYIGILLFALLSPIGENWYYLKQGRIIDFCHRYYYDFNKQFGFLSEYKWYRDMKGGKWYQANVFFPGNDSVKPFGYTHWYTEYEYEERRKENFFAEYHRILKTEGFSKIKTQSPPSPPNQNNHD